MTHVLILAGSLWLLFNLFLFAWLGPEARAELSKMMVDHFRASLRRPHQRW